MTINAWWSDRPEERYWMIAPSRGVVGEALTAPKTSDHRRFEWSHELVGFTEPGDTLFVWDRTLPVPGIGAWGRVLGALSPRIRRRPVRVMDVANLSVSLTGIRRLSSRFGFEFAL